MNRKCILRTLLGIVSGLNWCTASTVAEAPLPLIRDMPLESAWHAPGRIVIPTSDKPAGHEVRFPAVPFRKKSAVCLRFQARLHTPTPGGWNPYLGISVNGRQLGRFTRAGTERLLKRAEFVETTLRGPLPWWGKRSGMPVLFTVFGPSDALDRRILSEREEGYWYLLDVSDMIHYRRLGADGRVESEAPNRIVFTNTCLKRFFPGRKTGFPDMIVDDLEVGWLPPPLAGRLRELHMDQYAPIQDGKSLRGDGWELHVDDGGGMQLNIGRDRYWLAAFLSYPATPEKRFNGLTPGTRTGGPEWNPRVRRTKDNVLEIEARCAEYRLQRTVRAAGDVLRVRDTLTNLREEPVGLVVRNCLTLPKLPIPDTYRLAGTDREALIGGCAANPTVFAAQADSSVGIVVEDNVYRLQLELMRHANTFQLQTAHLGIDARTGYTLEWTIYPGRSRDYFDFVNRVRRAWRVNYTIDGPFVFDSKVVPGRGARLFVFGPWLDYHHDGSQTRDSYRKTVSPILAELRKQVPTGVFMPKIETNLYTILKSKLPDGDRLPGSDRKTGRYGFVLDPEQSRILEKGIGPWKDSILYAPNNRIIIDTYYEGYHRNGKDLFNLLLYLRKGNTRYRLFMDQIDFCMDALGFNGIYIDQFSQAGTLSRKDRSSWDRWDGRTVDLGPDGRITGKRTDCNLVGATARADILEYIFRKGGKVVINGQSTVRETRSFPAWRFQEMDNDGVNPLEFLHDKPPIFYWQARGHLGCPLILGVRPVRYGKAGRQHWAEAITKGVITALRNGVLYYYYTSTVPDKGPGAGGYGPVRRMFPFTPVELHEGWIMGKERTVTCISGPVLRPVGSRPRVHRFNLRGLPIPADFPTRRTPAGWAVDVKIRDWQEIVIVEDPPT
ncbi:MAG: hypothetical protein GXP31_14685 [Kiritimatiellaeota bacterium]|nr:hypothetical protein [Kiritimatiellota bacterium]